MLGINTSSPPGHDRTVRLWNPTKRDPAFLSSNNKFSNNHSTTITSNTVPLHDIAPALPIQSYTDGHTHPVSSVAVDSSSTTLLSASDKALVATDVVTRKLRRRFAGHHTGRINTVACAEGAEAYLSGSYDGTVRVWDGRSWSGNPIMVLDQGKDSITSVGVRQDKMGVAGAGIAGGAVEIYTGSVDGTVRTYDLRRGELRADDLGQDVAITSVAPTADGLLYVVGCLDGRIHLLDTTNGTSVKTFGKGHTAGRYSLSCTPTADDKHVVCGSEDGAVVVYGLEDGRVVQTLRGHVRPTCAVVCHPVAGRFESVVVSGSYDGEGVVWTNGDASLIELE